MLQSPTSSRWRNKELTLAQGGRNGASLIELLIVMGIVALLGGSLLSAVQSARAAGYRVQCANNLRQIGIGLLQYHDDGKHFPMGVTSEKGNMPLVHWQARILPFLEQGALWEQIQAAYREYDNFLFVPPHDAQRKPLDIYICPMDGRKQSHNLPKGNALVNYLGVSGRSTSDKDGVLFVDSKIRLSEITDGASFTLLVGERPPGLGGTYGWWYAGLGQPETHAFDAIMGVRDRNHPYYREQEPCGPGPFHFQNGELNNPCSTFHFWSLHRGGAHFLTCDGALHFWAYSADRLLPALATRSGQESPDLP